MEAIVPGSTAVGLDFRCGHLIRASLLSSGIMPVMVRGKRSDNKKKLTNTEGASHSSRKNIAKAAALGAGLRLFDIVAKPKPS